jgi:regulatory protein
MENQCEIITKIEVQKKNKNRVNIYVDEEFLLACDAELVYVYNIFKGKKVELEELKEVVNEDNYIKCKNQALRIIEKSYKTEKQIYDKLIDKGYGEKTVKRTMEFLKQYDLINDEKYVNMYIKDKVSSQGKNRIKYDLIKKGIVESMVSEKLKEIDDSIEEATALILAHKKYNIIIKTKDDNRKVYKILGDYLIRSGYNSDIVQKTLSAVVKRENTGVDQDEEKNQDNYIEKDKIYELAQKRYGIIIKSETDTKKAYKKLADYLLRRGYDWDSIRNVLNFVVNNSYI